MKLTINRNPVIGYPVESKIFDEKGEVQTIGFTVLYKRVENGIRKKLLNGVTNLAREEMGLESSKDDKGKVHKWPYKTDADFFNEYITGWVGVHDEKGEPLDYSVENRTRLLENYPELNQPVFQGFFDAHEGARVKN